jgi:hypothetical protein
MLFKPDTLLSIKPSTKYGEIIEAGEAEKLKNLILSGRT